MNDRCKHELAEQDTYVADGYCPLCLLDQIESQQQRIDELERDLVHWNIAQKNWTEENARLQERLAKYEKNDEN